MIHHNNSLVPYSHEFNECTYFIKIYRHYIDVIFKHRLIVEIFSPDTDSHNIECTESCAERMIYGRSDTTRGICIIPVTRYAYSDIIYNTIARARV